MKNFRFLLSVLFGVSFFSGFAQPRNPRLDSLLNDKDSAAVASRVSALLKSSVESDVNLGVLYYARKNDIPHFELYRDMAIARFPVGYFAYIRTGNGLVGASEPAVKEDSLKVLETKFSDRNNDMYVFDVADTYAGIHGKIDEAKILGYTRKVGDLGYRSIIAETLFSHDHLDLATVIVREGMDTLKTALGKDVPVEAPSYDHPPRPNPKSLYNRYSLLYARILVRQGRASEALPYAEAAYKAVSSPNWDVTLEYIDILLANNRLTDAFPLMEKACRQGQATPAIKEKLKAAYVSVKGSAAGYDQLLASIDRELQDSAAVLVAKFATARSAAPGFLLKNLRGETVSLSDLRGKVVVLDFWATWCGPCKKSFPAMQQAVNKFRNDKGVVFLFVDTWEHGKDPLPGVKEYITSHKYSFNVVLDLADAATRKCPVVESYQVTGIPTKFVIDKEGRIAYRLTGFSGGDDFAVAELAAMIESASKS